MSLHDFAPASLLTFLDDVNQASNLDVNVAKARSSHTAILSVPHANLAAVQVLAQRSGLSFDIGRRWAQGDRVQVIVKVLPRW